MLSKTHKILNLTVALGYTVNKYEVMTIPQMVCVCIGSTIPDIDNPSSWWGQTFPWIQKHLKHRGITHTVYPVLLFIFLYTVTKSECLLAFTFGYGMHLLEDAFSKQGINPFLPDAKPIRLPIAYVVGGKFERRVRVIAWIFFIYYIIEWFALASGLVIR